MPCEPTSIRARPIVIDVLRQHAELAAFLWAQRDTLCQADPVDPNVIAGIDKRLEANLDALRIAGEAAWPFILQQYEDFPEKGELFVAGFFAIDRSDFERIDQVLQFGRESSEAAGLVGALAWLPAGKIGSLVRHWIASADAFKRLLAVSACVAHGVDPKGRLQLLMRDGDVRVRAKAYELAGGLCRRELADDLRRGLDEMDDAARIQAATSLLSFGSEPAALAELKRVAARGGLRSAAVMRSVVAAAPSAEVRAWLGDLLKDSQTVPLAIRGVGMLGDRAILHWLIHRMRTPAWAQAAGLAFLELFPEARGDGELFSIEASVLGEAFAEHFDDDPPYLPAADRIKDWARARKLLE